MITIQPTLRHEIYEIAAFLDDSWRVAYRKILTDEHFNAMSVEERYRRLLGGFDEKSLECLVMRDHNTLVGVTGFGKSHTDDYPDDGEISAIYLHHDYWDKGHGHRLLVKAEEALATKGYTHFVLNVLSENTRAVRFYQKQGYGEVDDRNVALRGDEYPLRVKVFRKKNETSKEA